MKKILIIIILITGLFAQFSKGTISAGALFNYSSSESGGDYSDTETQTSIGTKYSYNMTVQPTFSYFLQPNISVDGYIGLNSVEEENCYPGSYDSEECSKDEASLRILGGGATYYVNNLYAGMGVATISSESGDSDYKSTAKYLEFHGGYLHPLTQNVYLDIGLSQLSGIDVYETEYNGESCGSDCQDNEFSKFDFKVGIKAFF